MKSTFVIPFVNKHTSRLQKMETEHNLIGGKEELRSEQACSDTVDKLNLNCCYSEDVEQVLESANVQNIKEIVKLVHCRKYLSVILMHSGELILLCPSSPKVHGRRVTVSDLASFSSCVKKNLGVNNNGNNNVANTTDIGAMESDKHNTNNTLIEVATVNASPHSSSSSSSSFSVAAISHVIAKGTSSACTESIIDVAAGDAHVVCCTSHGKCYSFGFDNMYGQLGDGTVWTDRPPKECIWEQLVSQEKEYDGEKTNNGSNGINDNNKEKKTHDIWLSMPHPMLLNVPVKQISCGSEHSLLLSTACNAVYACGRGDCGQLGNIYNTHIHKSKGNSFNKELESLCKPELQQKGEPVLLQPRPKLIRLLFGLPIQSIAACNSHNFVLLATHKLLVFGDNTFGQLGLGHTHQILTPTSVKIKHDKPQVEKLEIDEPTSVCATDANELQSSKCAKRILDAKLFNSLRAPYDTNLSVYYPLTISRISEECNRNDSDYNGACDICVDAVWCGETLTIIRTCDGEWMSCGLAPRRSWHTIHESCEKIQNKEQCELKFDCSSSGVLGRMLTEREHAYYFAPMQISEELEMAYRKHVQMYLQSSEEETEEFFHQSKLATKQKYLNKDESEIVHGKDNSFHADINSCNHFANNVSASSWMHIVCHPQALLFWLVSPMQVKKAAKEEITKTKNVNSIHCSSCNNDNTFNCVSKCTNHNNSEHVKVWLQSNTIVPIVALDKCVKHLLEVCDNNNDENTDRLYHKNKTNCTSFVLPSHSCILSYRNCALVQAM